MFVSSAVITSVQTVFRKFLGKNVPELPWAHHSVSRMGPTSMTPFPLE